MPSAPRPACASPRLPLLDGLRTFAALGVMFYHAPELFGPTRLFTRGYLLVDLFFLLSGFVLALSAEPRLRAGLSVADFLRARVVRLWPVMALGVLAAAAVFLPQAGAPQTATLLLLGMLMIPLVHSPAALFPLNAPQWSLLWELIANALHALVLHRLGERALLALAALFGGALLTAILAAGWNGSGPNAAGWWLAAPRIGWSYTLGIWMARRWQRGAPAPVLGWRAALVLPVLATMALPWLPLDHAAGDALAVLLVLPALFWIAASARPPKSAEPALRRLGALSYPLYALHAPVLLAVHFQSDAPAAKLLGVLATLGAALAVARIGPPLRAALGRGRPQSPAPARLT